MAFNSCTRSSSKSSRPKDTRTIPTCLAPCVGGCSESHRFVRIFTSVRFSAFVRHDGKRALVRLFCCRGDFNILRAAVRVLRHDALDPHGAPFAVGIATMHSAFLALRTKRPMCCFLSQLVKLALGLSTVHYRGSIKKFRISRCFLSVRCWK